MKIKGYEFTFGADPELFIRHQDSTEYLVSAEGFIQGSKEAPFPVKDGAFQLDGMAAEFNIVPVKTEKGFLVKIKRVLKQLKESLPEGYSLCSTPVAHFSEDTWKKASDESKQLGCNPDFNAYTGNENPAPNAKTEFRTGSGHIHIGWGEFDHKNDKDHFNDCRFLVAHLDWYLGTPLSKAPGNDPRRTRLYGKPGAFRPTRFGLEYRSPSNYWLSSEDRVKFAITQTMKGLRRAVEDPISGEVLYLNQNHFLVGDDVKCP